MHISIAEILSLVGPLDDSPGENNARERFRAFLAKNVVEVGELRDHIEECLRTSGDQYNKALQDLVNFTGRFLGFEVSFGRYRGVTNEVGFDGLWKSPTGLGIVVEVKTSDTYAIKTSTLVGYVDELISDKRISNWRSALGLYIMGRPDPEIKQLQNAITAEHRMHQLRTISVESLLSLAELAADYDITHEDVLAILRPSEPAADSFIQMLVRLAAGSHPPQSPESNAPSRKNATLANESGQQRADAEKSPAAFWLTPVKDHESETAQECIEKLVGRFKQYAFGERTPGRKQVKRGDSICFYANGVGIVAHATVTTSPENKPSPHVIEPEIFSYTFGVDNVHLYTKKPVVLDAALRSKLSAFDGRDPDKPWAWFVQGTHKVTEGDFRLLTREERT
jgi:hypothetical protein